MINGCSSGSLGAWISISNSIKRLHNKHLYINRLFLQANRDISINSYLIRDSKNKRKIVYGHIISYIRIYSLRDENAITS